MSSQQVDAIVSAALSTDEALMGAARELTQVALIEIDNILRYGTPAAKQQILRSFIPAIVRAGGEKTENEELGELKKQFEAFRASVMGYEIPEDQPAPP